MERLWGRTTRTGDCWVWQGATISNRNGERYGVISYEGRSQGVHRVALLVSGVDVPARHHVHHRCGMKLCVNPDHLEVATPKQHSDEHPERRRGINNAVKTHCPKGHPYNQANTIYYAGKRFCRECKRLSRR